VGKSGGVLECGGGKKGFNLCRGGLIDVGHVGGGIKTRAQRKGLEGMGKKEMVSLHALKVTGKNRNKEKNRQHRNNLPIAPRSKIGSRK